MIRDHLSNNRRVLEQYNIMMRLMKHLCLGYLHNYVRPCGNKAFWELSTINVSFSIQLSGF